MPISFEFFPPKNDIGAAHFAATLRNAAAWNPSFVSVTCGAGGSAVDNTFDTVKYIGTDVPLHVVPHIAFIRLSKQKLEDVLQRYKALGVKHVVALRGDPAVASREPPPAPEDSYPTTIDFIADIHSRLGLEPIVTAYPDVHPLAGSAQQDLDHLRRKTEVGARRAITQFFFVPETYLRFRDKVRQSGIDITLIPGMLPVHNLAQILKFSSGCGAKVPDGFGRRFERWGDDKDALLKEGINHTVELCESLRREGVNDFHFYTLNRNLIMDEICTRLGFDRACQPAA